MSSRKQPTGRAFLAFAGKGEAAAFRAYMKDQYAQMGGRNAVMAKTGLSGDMLSKYTSGRAIPSRKTIEKLIDTGVLPYSSADEFAAATPWLGAEYRRAAREEAAPALNREVAPEPEAPAPAPVNLMEAVMAEPGLSNKQRAQLAAIIAMIVNGVDVTVNIAPRQ